MVILSIADLHLRADESAVSHAFNNSLNNFDSFIKKIITSDSRWKPDFICICGDIANKALNPEFAKATEVINKIANASGLTTDYVMCVPGNHDLNRPDDDRISDALTLVNDWLDGNAIYKKVMEAGDYKKQQQYVRQMRQTVRDMFGRYAIWRSGMLQDKPGMRYFDLMEAVGIKELRGLCGLRIFDSDKVAFAELNSSWCDLGGKNRDVRFGHMIVNSAYQELEHLKHLGYFIVGLFHHSMRFLNVYEYQARSSFEVYDNIVRICDVCLSGHEHGAQAKDPDFLGNRCQYILNAGFMSNDPQNKILESGATLIRINRYEETLQIRKLTRNTDNTWHDNQSDNEIATYSLSVNRHAVPYRPSTASGHDGRILNPEDHRIRIAAIIRLFGSGYSLGEPVKEAPDTYKLIDGLSKAVGYVTFVSGHNCSSAQLLIPDAEPGRKLFVIRIDSNHFEEVDMDFLVLKQRYSKEIMAGRVVFLNA